MNVKETIRRYISIGIEKGFSYIFVSSLINKVIVLLSTVALNRLLSQTDYGNYSYAYNIISVVMVVSSLGVDVALLQFCCEERDEEEKQSLILYAIKVGLVTNLTCSALTYISSFVCFRNLPEASDLISRLSFLLPFPFIVSYCSMILRSELRNREYAILTNISSIAYLVCLVVFTSFLNLRGAVIGRYLGFMIPAACGLIFIKEHIQKFKFKDDISPNLKKQFLTYGTTVTLTNGVSSLLYYIDIYVVGLITSDAVSIASYKTATIIPNALAALPTIIVTFIYPFFAKNKDNRAWIIQRARTIQALTFLGSLLLAVMMYVSAPTLIEIVFGEQYLDSVLPFRILLISFVISGPFRVITGNIIAMLGRVKANFYIGLISCLLNVVVDYLFIKAWGSVGAAIATTLIMLFAAVVSNLYLYFVYGRDAE